MDIRYDAYWKTEKGNFEITHGIITDEELQEFVEKREREESSKADSWKFDSASWDDIKM